MMLDINKTTEAIFQKLLNFGKEAIKGNGDLSLQLHGVSANGISVVIAAQPDPKIRDRLYMVIKTIFAYHQIDGYGFAMDGWVKKFTPKEEFKKEDYEYGDLAKNHDCSALVAGMLTTSGYAKSCVITYDHTKKPVAFDPPMEETKPTGELFKFLEYRMAMPQPARAALKKVYEMGLELVKGHLAIEVLDLRLDNKKPKQGVDNHANS